MKRHTAWSTLAVLACSVPAFAATHEVRVRDFAFDPADITVAVGDTVRWVWESGIHTVTSGDNCTADNLYFNAPSTQGDPTFEWVVPDGVATVPYFCIPHCFQGMVGTITVDPNAVHFVMTIDGPQVPTDSTATGTGTATYYPSTSMLAWEIEFSGLSSPQTNIHFHGPARPCENAGVALGLPMGSPISGIDTLTPEQAADLLAGLWYVNIHTQNHTGGEIRGQVMPAPLDDPLPAPIPASPVTVQLDIIADGMTAPNWGTHAPGIADRLYVTDQDGILWSVDLVNHTKAVFLDVSSRLVSLGVGGPGTFDERGLLGVAFHPDYATNGLLCTYTSEPEAGPADFSTIPPGEVPNHQSVILEWQVPNPADPNAVVDPNSARELLRIDQPQFNHDGGAVVFGPDGQLYIALGDGGRADDQGVGHVCLGNGASPENILGSIIRIDPSGTNSANGQYGIPADNPFVGMEDVVQEIYAYGFRNPFRISFDALTGDLYCADVGQHALEEINLVASGGNYGWRWKEGSFFFAFNGQQRGYVFEHPVDVPAGLIDPIAEYDHDEGIAIVGGFVYHGTDLPDLQGLYVFGEYNAPIGRGRLFHLDPNDAILELQFSDPNFVDGLFVHGFGQDAAGEVYLLGNRTGIPFDSTGVVLRLAPVAPAGCPGDYDCDGDRDFFDIDLLLAALGGEQAWADKYMQKFGTPPPCDFLTSADTNGDGAVDFFDIDGFLAALGQDCP